MSLEDDIGEIREAIRRQDGCSDPLCHVCKANARRGQAAERVIEAARRHGEGPPTAGSVFDSETLTRCVIRQDAIVVVDDRGTVVRFSELLAAWQAQQQKEATWKQFNVGS